MLSRLVELLFVALFSHPKEVLADKQRRPLAALRDPFVSQALEELHARPQYP